MANIFSPHLSENKAVLKWVRLLWHWNHDFLLHQMIPQLLGFVISDIFVEKERHGLVIWKLFTHHLLVYRRNNRDSADCNLLWASYEQMTLKGVKWQHAMWSAWMNSLGRICIKQMYMCLAWGCIHAITWGYKFLSTYPPPPIHFWHTNLPTYSS